MAPAPLLDRKLSGVTAEPSALGGEAGGEGSVSRACHRCCCGNLPGARVEVLGLVLGSVSVWDRLASLLRGVGTRIWGEASFHFPCLASPTYSCWIRGVKGPWPSEAGLESTVFPCYSGRLVVFQVPSRLWVSCCLFSK